MATSLPSKLRPTVEARMRIPLNPSQRRAVAGVIAALFLFLMIFTAGLGFFLYQNQSNLLKYQANANDIAASGQTSLEKLSLFTSLQSSNIVVDVNNTGGTIATVEAAYIKNQAGQIVSPPGIMMLSPAGGTNRSSPLNLAIGEHGGLLLSSYTYAGSPVYIYLLTSRGNLYSAPYPFTTSGSAVTVTSTTTVSSISTVGAIGNPLVVVMTATPPQAFGGNTLTLNITFYNFALSSLTSPALNPAAPLYFLTGTATLTPLGCTGPSSGTIPAYSGSGTPPSIYFLCTYTAHTGPLGGVASFGGAGEAVYNGSPVYSAEASSNLVQIGGLSNALTYGAFSINFFLFRYTSCTNEPILNGSGSSSNYYGGSYPVGYSSPCTTRTVVPSANWETLPSATNLSASGNYYVAFYLQVTNNFNSSLVISQYTMMQLDQSDAVGESDWWLVGNANQLTNGVYYPNYNPGGNNLPTLTSYPSNCITIPTPSGCFDLGPGQSQVFTLAACSYSNANWDWGGVPNADHFDVKSGGFYGGNCVSAWPQMQSVYNSGAGSLASLVVAFYYKGHVFTQDIQFEAVSALH